MAEIGYRTPITLTLDHHPAPDSKLPPTLNALCRTAYGGDGVVQCSLMMVLCSALDDGVVQCSLMMVLCIAL